MAAYDLEFFDLTQEQIDALGGDPSQITYMKVWDPHPPTGWLVVAKSLESAQIVCPKPCG